MNDEKTLKQAEFNAQVQNFYAEVFEVAQKFIGEVETGKARSKETYEDMKKLSKRCGEIQDSLINLNK